MPFPPLVSPPLPPADDIASLIHEISADRIGSSALIKPLLSELPAELAFAPEDESICFHSFSHLAKSACEEDAVGWKTSVVLMYVAGRYEVALDVMAFP
jgi:hypothetical protein